MNGLNPGSYGFLLELNLVDDNFQMNMTKLHMLAP